MKMISAAPAAAVAVEGLGLEQALTVTQVTIRQEAVEGWRQDGGKELWDPLLCGRSHPFWIPQARVLRSFPPLQSCFSWEFVESTLLSLTRCYLFVFFYTLSPSNPVCRSKESRQGVGRGGDYWKRERGPGNVSPRFFRPPSLFRPQAPKELSSDTRPESENSRQKYNPNPPPPISNAPVPPPPARPLCWVGRRSEGDESGGIWHENCRSG
eukprot:Hpha_TRINITY_DN10543_c0_g1::TRINITY_DN10543_c0_g1_i1::g.31582::m.31582